jgi:hypothetical protein
MPTMVAARYLSERKNHNKEGSRREYTQKAAPNNEDAKREIESEYHVCHLVPSNPALIAVAVRRKLRIEGHAYIDRIEQFLSTPIVEKSKLQVASIDWLRTQGQLPKVASTEEATKSVLSSTVTDQEFSRSLCQMLEHWKDWVGRGAMGVEDFSIINQAKDRFAQASLMIATLSSLETGPAAAPISIQECVEKWEYVELG